MFGTIRRHQKWLWWIIAVVTIATFGVLGPSSCNDIKLGGAGGGNYGKIGDHAITPEELGKTEREVILRYFLSTQRWPEDKDINLKREAYIRLFMIEKEKQFGIQVSEEALRDYAQHILGSAPLDTFVTQLLKPKGLDEGDFERFLTHEAGAQQLITVAGLSGKMVTPSEAETLYRLEHVELATSMILLSASNYLPTISVTNAALMGFYSNRMSLYREPARVQVNYVKFNVTNYFPDILKKLTNLEATVDMEVKRAGTNLFGKTKTPEESRAAIKDFILRTNSLPMAQRDANKFASDLYNMTPKKPENLEALAKTNGLTVMTTEPFDEVQGPKDLDVLYNFSKTAFQLTPDEPFSGMVPERDGVYVLGLNKMIPSYIPPFKTVSTKVMDDFRTVQGAFMAQQMGSNYYGLLTSGLAAGKSFNVAAAELGLKTESLPPISLSTQKLPESLEDRVSLAALRQAGFSTEIGKVSPLARAQHGVFLLYVEKKLPIDEGKMKTELPGFLTYMRQARQGDAFNQWFSVQIRQDPAFAALLQEISQETPGRQPTRRGN